MGDGTAVPALSFVAPSGTGKTTLLEGVIAALKARGYRVGALKHDAHRFDIDHPGKDSHRLTVAGADTMLITSGGRLALVKQQTAAPPLVELLATYCADLDIVLVEGFRTAGLPRLRLCRDAVPASRPEHYPDDDRLLAVASDVNLELAVPRLDLNDPPQVADFIVRTLLGGAGPRRQS